MSEESKEIPEDLLESLRIAREKLNGLKAHFDTSEELEDEPKKDLYLTTEKAKDILNITGQVLEQIATANMLLSSTSEEVRALAARLLTVYSRVLSHLEK